MLHLSQKKNNQKAKPVIIYTSTAFLTLRIYCILTKNQSNIASKKIFKSFLINNIFSFHGKHHNICFYALLVDKD